MPKAPKYTKKEQIQRDIQWRRESKRAARLEGAQEAFPGAPIWNDWIHEQRQAKKRDVGFTKRLGRAAVSTVANLVLIAKDVPRVFSENREEGNRQKAERYQRSVNLANSKAVLPQTHLGEIAKSKRRRLGLHILSLTNRVNRNGLQRSTQKAERLAKKNQAASNAKRGPVESWANKKLDLIDDKRQQALDRRLAQFETEKQKAWEKHLEENPEKRKRLTAEQNQRDRQYEVNMQNDRYFEMQKKANQLGESFAKRDSDAFSRSLPRRFGITASDYDDLAKSTLKQAADKRYIGGSFSLLNYQILGDVVTQELPLTPTSVKRTGPVALENSGKAFTTESFTSNNWQLHNNIQDQTDYVGGAAAALWKLGFVEFDSDTAIRRSGESRMNDAIEWSQGEDGSTLASLAYDPDNELHRIVAGEPVDPQNARIQLAINDSQGYGTEMDLQLIRQPAYAHAS